MKKQSILMLLGLLILVFMVQPIFASQENDPIKIGVLYELSGPLAEAGGKTAEGVKLAADIVNNNYPDLGITIGGWEGIPNLGNRKIELIVMDTRANPSHAGDLTKKLINDDKVVAIIGCRLSSVTKLASAVAEKNGIPMVCGSATSPLLTERGFKWFWRTSPNDRTFIEDAFKFYEGLIEGKVRGVGPVPREDIDDMVVACENTEWGAACKDVIDESALKYDFKVHESILYPHETPDLSSEAQKLLGKNPETMMLVPYLSDAILWVRTLKSFKASPKILWGQSGTMFRAFGDAVGSDGDGILTRTVFEPSFSENKPAAKKVNELYKATHDGEGLGGASARAFIALQTLANALNNAGSTEPEAIQKALNEIDIPAEELITPYYGVRFDENGQNELGAGLICQWQDNDLQVIYPFDLATADMIYPLPGWK